MLKNIIDDLLGYQRCPITNNTFWRNQKYVIDCTDNNGICISEEAKERYNSEEIGRIVYEISKSLFNKQNIYSLEKIIESIENVKKFKFKNSLIRTLLKFP